MVLFSTKRGELAKAMKRIGDSRKGSEFGVYFQILEWLFLPDQASSSVTPPPKKDRKRLGSTRFRYGEKLQEGRMGTRKKGWTSLCCRRLPAVAVGVEKMARDTFINSISTAAVTSSLVPRPPFFRQTLPS